MPVTMLGSAIALPTPVTPMFDTRDLFRQAQDGKSRAVDALLRRHRNRLTAFIAGRLGDARCRASSDDLAQETLLEASRKLSTYRPDQGSFYRWLVGIAKHKISEARRAERAKKRSHEVTLAEPPVAQQTSLPSRAARADDASRLREALDDLPEQQARAVELRFLEGLSIAEVASQMGRSPSAVKALVSRGLQKLSRRLTGPGRRPGEHKS